MAKQIGPIKIQGTLDNLVFYKLHGEYYVRKKSSLNSKRVKKDPAFKRTMTYADLMRRASPIASQRCRHLPKGKRVRVFRKMTGQVMRELKKKEGWI